MSGDQVFEFKEKLMKGQKCSREQFVKTLWHYCHFSPPGVAASELGLSRQSVGLIYRKLGRRARSVIPDVFLIQMYKRIVHFGASQWVKDNEFFLGSFGDVFFDGFTREYDELIRKNGGKKLEGTLAWEFVNALNTCWGGVPRKSFEDHIGIAFYRAFIFAQVKMFYADALENNRLDEFYATTKKYHPMVPSDINLMLHWDNITHITTGSFLEELERKPLD